MIALLLALVGAAAAAVPVQLPPGESAAAWAEPLAMAGLVVGSASGGANVQIRSAASGWVLVVRSADGRVHEVPVSPATTDAAREDIGWLASSLLDGVSVPSGPAPVAPPPPAAASAPSRTVRPSAPVVVAPAPAPVQPPSAVVPEPAPEPAPVPPAVSVTIEPLPAPGETQRVRLSIGAGSALALRPGTGPTADFAIDTGVLPRVPVYLGFAVSGTPPAPLTQLVGDQTLSNVDLSFIIGYHPDAPVAPRADLGVGVAWRQFKEADAIVAIVPFPTLSVRGGVAFRVADWASVEPGVRLGADLRGADLAMDGGKPVALSPWSFGLGVTFRSTFDVANVESR